MKKNIIANVFGRLWGLLSAFLFIPLYIKFLGFESYSVISFTLLLAGILAVLDAGLTASLTREFAREDKNSKQKFLAYQTLEVLYLGIVALALCALILFAAQIAGMLNVKSFSIPQLAYFIKIVSIDIGFQLLLRFYMGGLLGLEKQVLANMLQVGWGIFRNAVAVLIIWQKPSLEYFFIWQAFSTVLFTILYKFQLDRRVAPTGNFNLSIRFSKDIFQDLRNFAGGILLISVVATINTQMDKLFISKLLSIENLGYYTLAISLSTMLMVVVNPVATAVLPRFTSLYTSRSTEGPRHLFAKAGVVISVLVFSFLSVIIFFPKEILWVWTGNLSLADHAADVVPIVAAGYAAIALQVLPYHVALANGFTKLNNIIGICSLLVTFPGYIFGIKYFGMMGAASVFLFVQGVTLVVYLFFINKKFIGEEFFKNLFVRKLLLPLCIGIVCCGIFKMIPFSFFSVRIFSLVWIALIGMFTFILISLFLLSKDQIKTIVDLPKRYINGKKTSA